MSARKQSKRDVFAAFARRERARRRQMYLTIVEVRSQFGAEWHFPTPTPSQVKASAEMLASMEDARRLIDEVCGIRPWFGFDPGRPGGDRSATVSWGLQNGKATLLKILVSEE